MESLGGELVEAFDDLLHRRGGGGGLRHRDFLDRMLIDRAGRFQLFQKIGAVNEFGDGDLVAAPGNR